MVTFEQIPMWGKGVKPVDIYTWPVWLTELFIVSVAILSFGDKMTSIPCPNFFKLEGEANQANNHK